MTDINWSALTFSYTKTNTILSTTFKNGAWTPVESLTPSKKSVKQAIAKRIVAINFPTTIKLDAR